MEKTFIRFAKSRCDARVAGLTIILKKYVAYQLWIRTTFEQNQYYQAMLEMSGISVDSGGSNSGKHYDQLKPEIKWCEADDNKFWLNAINGFFNPNGVIDKDCQNIFYFGNPVPTDIEHYGLNAEYASRLEKEKFVFERLQKVDDNEEK